MNPNINNPLIKYEKIDFSSYIFRYILIASNGSWTDFAGLWHEVQNLIIEQAWADIETVENMKQLALSDFDVFQKAETSFAEQNK